MLSRKFGAIAVAAFLGAAASVGVTTGARAEDWKCYTYQSAPTSPVVIGLQKIATSIEQATQGRVRIKCNVGGSLPIDANSIAPAMADGILDLVTNGYISGYVPIGAMGLLPGLFKDLEEFHKGYAVLKPIFDREFEKRGIVTLGIYTYPDQVIWGSREIRSLEDLKGRTLRVANPEQAAFAQAFGAVPVTLATPEVAPALQRGAVQYVITAAASGGRLWRDSFKSGLLNPVNTAIGWIQISKKRYDSLSPDERAALHKTADETANWITQTMIADNDKAIKEFTETYKWTITPRSDAEQAAIRKAMQPVWQKWAEERGPEAVRTLAEIRKVIGDM